jgi:hypothetical protein
VERVWRALPALLLLLSGVVPFPAAAEGLAPEPGFQLPLGDRGILRVNDDGSFSLQNGAALLSGSSHWSVRLGDSIISPGTDAYRSALLSPLHLRDNSLTMVFYEGGMVTEIAYQAEGTTAVLTVTTVNRWYRNVNVTFRCGLGLLGLEAGFSETGILPNETEVSPGEYSQLSGYLAGAEVFSCLMPDAPAVVKVVASAERATGPYWGMVVNGSTGLSENAGVAIYWPQRTLAPLQFYRVRLLLSAGPAGPVAIPQRDLRVDGLGVNPGTGHEREARRVLFGIQNRGPAAETQVTVLYLLEGVPFSMMFSSLQVEWNQTVWTELGWSPGSAGNYTVLLMLPMFGDRDPTDNLGTAAAAVTVNPFRFTMKFSTSDVASSYKAYPGARFKVQIYIYNTGFSPDAYNVSVKGVPDGWTVLLSNNNLSLEPNKIAYVWLTVQPSHTAPNGTYAFNIYGRSYASGERQSLVEMVEIGPPPPPGTGYAPPGYRNLLPSNGSTPPPVAIRPYATPDTSAAGWFARGDRSRLAFSALGVLAVAVAIMILGVAIYQASNMHTINVLRRIIKRALYGLVTGDEYRMIIFDAYRKMCGHLARFGYTREEHVTPREFSRALKLALPLDTRSIRMLTRLFEEARYSDHEMGEPGRQAAIESLRYIEAELDKLTSFVEEESGWTRLRKRVGLGES